MKKFLALAASLGILATPGGAFFDENVDELVANVNSESVVNVVATGGDGNVILMWDPKTNEDEEEASQYRIEYGENSVVDGMASEYDSSRETPDSLPGDKITGLKNGTEYFFAVTALFEDGTESVRSEEVSATPTGTIGESVLSAPIVSAAKANGSTVIEVVFSEDVMLPEESPEAAFAIVNEETGEAVSVSASAQLEDATKVSLETEDSLVVGESYRVTVSAKITDLEGNPIESGSTDSATFVGVEDVPHNAAGDFVADEEPVAVETTADEPSPEDSPGSIEEEDITPPEDVTNFVADFKARVADFLVTLKWTASVNTEDDLSAQILYRSLDKGVQWDGGRTIAADKTTATSAEKPETDVTYKLTVRDESGNESVGVIRSISLPALPETGSSMAFLAGLALLGAAGRKLFKK